MQNKVRKKRWCCLCCLWMFFLLLAVGCDTEKKEKKIRDLSYTVVGEQKIPEELKKQIEGKKQQEFQLTFTEEDGLYLVRGYGEKPTGGYSVQVEECYLTKKAIYAKTTLHGPAEDEVTSEEKSYPYIVLKMERQEGMVVFQ